MTVSPLCKILGVTAGAVLIAACQPKEPPAKPIPPVNMVETPPVQTSTVPAPPPPPQPAVFEPAPVQTLAKRKIVRSSIAEAPNILTVSAEEIPAEPTRILNHGSAERLFGNSGITLQWIDWDKRGQVWIAVDQDGYWWLEARQQSDDKGRMKMEGVVTEIGADYFIFDGEVTILGAPEADRFCDANKKWRFAITQNRKYWRLREFEWCDGLTDYIDIYF